MSEWHDYVTRKSLVHHTVVGTVKVMEEVWSPQLRNRRDILVYLPPSYAAGEKRYPVIYMHDGQNLFDQATSFAGEWQVDETMEALSQEGIEAIVVGIPNMGMRRIVEYSPFPGPRQQGGRANDYVKFITKTIKPMIDRDFRTLPDRVHTGTIGSSMGGLIALYAFLSRSDVFGFVGALSPSLWFGRRGIFDYAQQAAFAPGKVYLDVGTCEAGGVWTGGPMQQAFSKRFCEDIQKMQTLLIRKGYHSGQDVRCVEADGATHCEAEWAKRLPDALRFLVPRTRELDAVL